MQIYIKYYILIHVSRNYQEDDYNETLHRTIVSLLRYYKTNESC